MAELASDFAFETALAAPGTGTVSLGGAASAGLKTLVGAGFNGKTVRYEMFTETKSKWEKGNGLVTSGSPSTLTRNVTDSSTGGAAIDWQPGDMPIYIATFVSADDFASLRANHRGSTAPAAPLQLGMIWADTTNGVTAVAWKICVNTAASGTWVTFRIVNETTGKSALMEDKAADIASASSIDIGAADGNLIDITGTTGITALGTAKAGTRRVLRFTGSPTLTHNATSLILLGAANIQTLPGDRAEFWSLGSGNWLNTGYRRAHVLPHEMARGAIWGLTYANNGADATNDLDIAAGGCMDATGVYWIKTAALTKQSDVNWAVGNNAGGLDTGAVGNNDYYIWSIARSDTGVTDILYSLSSTAPTMPANYDYKRLIGWFKRVGATIVPFTTYEIAGGGLEFKWTTPTLDFDLANTLTTSRRTDALKVPLNLSTDAQVRIVMSDNTAGFAAVVCCPDEADVAPSVTAAPLANFFRANATDIDAKELRVRTSATGTIAARANLATVDVYRGVTLGFQWSRR